MKLIRRLLRFLRRPFIWRSRIAPMAAGSLEGRIMAATGRVGNEVASNGRLRVRP